MRENFKGRVLLQPLILFFLAYIGCSDGERTTSGDSGTSGIGTISLEEAPQSRFLDFFLTGRRIRLKSLTNFQLGPMPSLCAINRKGEFVILDYGAKQILVYDSTGTPIARIGTRGNGKGQYLFPDSVFYNQDLDRYFIYDSDLLKVLEFDRDFNHIFDLNLPMYLEQLLITNERRLFCYSSGAVGPEGSDYIIYEYDKSGALRNRFLRMPKTYASGAESKGGGIINIKGHFYVITPYEYTISKTDISGRIENQVQIKSKYFTALKPYGDKRVETDFESRKRYHSTWSHILQIVQIGEDRFGIIYNEAGTALEFLDIFSLDLEKVVEGILLPNHLSGPHAIYTVGERLYLIEPVPSPIKAYSGDLSITEYTFIRKETIE